MKTSQPGQDTGSSSGVLGNIVISQACVYAAVLGATLGQPGLGSTVALILVAVHLGFADRTGTELGILLTAGTFGCMVEVLEQQLGFFVFTDGSLVPFWVVVVWIGLGSMLRFALHGLSKRIWLAAVTGSIAGPSAFLAADRAGIIAVQDSGAYVGLAVTSAVALVGLVAIRRVWDRSLKRGRYILLNR